MITITKIKMKVGLNEIHYCQQDTEGSGIQESVLTSGEGALPAFIDAMEAFKADIETLCELPDGYMDDAQVTGMTITAGRLTVTALRPVRGASAPLVINTPSVHRENQHGPSMSSRMAVHLEDVLEQAERYLRGDRATKQMRLDVDG